MTLSGAAPTRRLAGKTAGPLAGLIVIDLTRVLAGPYCTMTLGDLGARVIKVEIPGAGDDARAIGPFLPNGDERPESGYFLSVNRNKESIALDLKNREDLALFDRLLASADILVENFTPGTLERLGYGWATLQARFPGLILTSISGFGQTGPYRTLPAYDMVVQAMGGVMSLTGEPDGPPTRVGISIGDIAAGMFGVMGVQAAVIERQRTGVGKHVDVAMFDSQVAMLENALVRYQVDGKVPGPIGSRHPSITPFGAFRAKDGYLVVAAGNDRKFWQLCDILGMAGARSDPRFASNGARCDHHVELAAVIEAALAVRDVGDWLDILTRAGIPCGPINDVAAVMGDPQLAARSMFVSMPTAGGRVLETAACPVRFVGEAAAPCVPAPALDADRVAIMGELGVV